MNALYITDYMLEHVKFCTIYFYKNKNVYNVKKQKHNLKRELNNEPDYSKVNIKMRTKVTDNNNIANLM